VTSSPHRIYSLLLVLAALLTPWAAHAVELRDVRLWENDDATRVVLDLAGGAEHKAFTLDNPNRLVIDLRAARRAKSLQLNGLRRGVVKAVRTGPRDDGLRVVLDLEASVQASAFSLEPNGEYGYRLVFDLKRVAAAPPPGDVTPALADAIVTPTQPPAPVPVPPPPPPPPQGVLIAPEFWPMPRLAYERPVGPPSVLGAFSVAKLAKVSASPPPKISPQPIDEAFIDLPEPALPTPPAPIFPPAARTEPAVVPPLALPPLPPDPDTPEDWGKPSPAPKIPGRQRDLVIAIDPGHGGADPGAIGQFGTREKDICLQISKRLAKLLNDTPGYRAVLTRSSDVYMPLRARTSVARKSHADLFLSIHANSMPVVNSVRGSAIYVLSERGASSEHARTLANLENAADLVGGVQLRTQEDDLASVLLDISQTAVREASFDLASRLLSSLGRRFVLQKREPQQAGFAVLKSPDVPSVLIETAFLSDERDERMLASAEHQQALAQSLYQGVKSYFNAYRPQPAGDYGDVLPVAIQPKSRARKSLPKAKAKAAP